MRVSNNKISPRLQWLQGPSNQYERLARILSDKVMRLNPYIFDDDALINCAERGHILPVPTFTQMAIFHFHEILSLRYNKTDYEAISYSIGNSPVRYSMAASTLFRTFSHHATYKPVHVQINGNNLTNFQMIEKLQGKTLFASHIIPENINNNSRKPGYRFHRLRGDRHAQADIIRRSMCDGKINILKEIMDYPQSPYYLGQAPQFDCYTPLWHAIEAVSHFHESMYHLPTLDELIKKLYSLINQQSKLY